jgi:hypothetical protein
VRRLQKRCGEGVVLHLLRVAGWDSA